VHLYDCYNDRQLLSLLQSSDERAFTELYNRYWEILFAISYNYCKHKETAEEIVQEVFMRLWDKRSAVNINDIGAYLATAVKFSIFKHITREKRRQELLAQYLAPQDAIDEEAEINARFLQEYVNGVIEKLPEQCRIVYKLRREEDLSIREIAEQLHLSPKTATNHLTKALKSIGLALKNSMIIHKDTGVQKGSIL
jgi:RNA polymerase sigma-70 factor (ECF subfamily)